MKVLIAEDNVVSRRTLEALLVKWGYAVVTAADGDEAWGVLQGNDPPKLAVLDWVMPGKNGVEICRSVRQRKGKLYTYILLLTGRGEKQDVVEGLEAGADDYVTKPFDPYELRGRLRAGRRIVELQEQLVLAREALRDQALRDPLTDLWNHKTILGILRKEVARASRTRSPVTAAMINVDQFKAINDTYGHPAGDAVVRETARRLRAAMRTYDALGRYGGDEFLAVIPACDAPRAASFAESFRARVDRKAIETPEGVIPVTLSLGVAAVADLRGVSSEALVRVADAALYRAKVGGRNRVVLATPEDFEREVSKHLPEDDEDKSDDSLPDLHPSETPA